MSDFENSKKIKFSAKTLLQDTVIILIGCLIYSVSIHCFTDPNDISPGGVTGIAQLIKDCLGLESSAIGLVGIIINIPIFIWAFIKLNWRLLINNVIATIGLYGALAVTGPFLPAYTDNMMITAILGGVIGGIGLGLIFTRGAATGGTDLIATLLKLDIPHMPVGKILLCIDGTVVAVSAVVYGLGSDNPFAIINGATYAAILIFILSKVIDVMIFGVSKGAGKVMFIMSPKNDEISKKVLNDIGRGVTKLKSCGAYTNTDGEMLFCAVRAKEVHKVYDLIKGVDERAFITVTDSSEVTGLGFRSIHDD